LFSGIGQHALTAAAFFSILRGSRRQRRVTFLATSDVAALGRLKSQDANRLQHANHQAIRCCLAYRLRDDWLPIVLA
jgi:hypothetical protein